MWTKTNKTLQNKTKINEDIYLSDNGTALLDTNKVAGKFDDYFTNVSQNLLKNFAKIKNQF